jgi:hypothetical protein
VGHSVTLRPCARDAGVTLGPADDHNDPGNQEVKETFNKSVPADDIVLFSEYIADYTQKMTTYAGSAVNPEEYGKQIVSRLCPNTLPYELRTGSCI